MYKISVIVPVYNTEPYLRKCLDGIVNQTHRNLEIIIVDDGSPDNSGAICDEYANRDNRIKVIHKKNGGLSAAWNDGIAMATGDFITFVDSDDWVDTFLFEKLLEAPLSNKADVIVANKYYEERIESNKTVEKVYFDSPFVFENGKGKTYLQTALLAIVDGKQKLPKMPTVWNKLYRTSFLKTEHISFNSEIRAGLGNDTLFNFIVFGKAQTVSSVDCAGYHYRFMDESATRKFAPNRPEEAHIYLDTFHHYIVDDENHMNLQKAFDAHSLVFLRGNFVYCYFNPKNTACNRTIAKSIKQMKKLPRYRDAIFSHNNRYLTGRQIVLKYALRQPFIWPLRILFDAKSWIK